MMVEPSRLPFHLVLLIRLWIGSPSATGEPGPSGSSVLVSSSTRISWRCSFGGIDLMLTIGAARSGGWLPAGLKDVSRPLQRKADAELHHQPVAGGVGRAETDRTAAGEGDDREVLERERLACLAGEIDDRVRALGGRHEQAAGAGLDVGVVADRRTGALLVAVGRVGELDRRVEEAAVRTNLPDRRAGSAVDVHVDAVLVE